MKINKYTLPHPQKIKNATKNATKKAAKSVKNEAVKGVKVTCTFAFGAGLLYIFGTLMTLNGPSAEENDLKIYKICKNYHLTEDEFSKIATSVESNQTNWDDIIDSLNKDEKTKAIFNAGKKAAIDSINRAKSTIKKTIRPIK